VGDDAFAAGGSVQIEVTLPAGKVFMPEPGVNSELTRYPQEPRARRRITLRAVLALEASAVLMWLVAAGFGIPAPFVASHFLRERTLPSFMGLFPMYGGGLFDRFSPEVFGVLLGLFTALCAFEAYAGWLLWNGEKLGAIITLALLPIEVVFWAGFAVPFPPLIAVARLGLLAAGWSILR